MKVTSEQSGECQVTLNIELEAAEVEKGLDKAYKRLVTKVKVPGFRPGKAPRELLEHQVGQEVLLQEALEDLVPDAYEEALKKESLEAVARPHIELLEKSPVTLKATVPTKPIITVGNYREQMRLQPEPAEVSQGEIDRTIKLFANQKATLTPVDRATTFGDVLTIDIIGSLQGEQFLDRKESACEIIKDAPAPLPGFAEKLVGANKGEIREFTLSFPADHEDQQLAGKDYGFKVTVSEIKEKKLPELDDEFAKSLGANTFTEWKDRIIETLKKRTEERVKRDFENKLIEAVTKFAEVKYPQALVEQEIDHTIDEESRNFKDGMKGLENYLKSVNKTMEGHRDELREGAKTRVIRSLVMEKVAGDEKIEVSEQEVDAEIERMLQKELEHADEMRQFWNLPQARHSIEHYLINSKTIALLSEIARGENPSTSGGKE
jgi:trigger factor